MNKSLPLVAVVLLGSTSIVHAQEERFVNAFGLIEEQDGNGLIEIDLVTAKSDGVVQIYEIDDHDMTNLLGEENVTAGANEGVQITLMEPALSDVRAVLVVDGRVVAAEEVEIESSSD